jgi:nitrate/TMAO reductase-like tetraheme cytochrome c subunit
MSKKKTIVIGVLLGVVVIGGVGGVAAWKYHEQPQFCAICHIMQPYLDSWQASDYGAHAHAGDKVACLDCHVPTVQQQVDELVVYMTGDFTAPLEQRDFGSDFCLDCHLPNEHTSEEEVIQLTAGMGVNPHDSHLVGEMDCETCHKMHGPSEDYCGECHGPVATGPGWTIPVSLTAEIDVWEPDMDCTVCHVMDPYVESLDNPDLLAYAHAQQGLTCLDCHTDQGELQQVHEEAVPGTPVKALTVDNQFCFDCHVTNEHTSYEQVIERTQDYPLDSVVTNPHDPHANVESDEYDLGPYQCSSCHKMHEESPLINYCLTCHHIDFVQSCSTADGCHGVGAVVIQD